MREDQAPMFGSKPSAADKAFSAYFCKRKSSVINQLQEWIDGNSACLQCGQSFLLILSIPLPSASLLAGFCKKQH